MGKRGWAEVDTEYSTRRDLTPERIILRTVRNGEVNLVELAEFLYEVRFCAHVYKLNSRSCNNNYPVTNLDPVLEIQC